MTEVAFFELQCISWYEHMFIVVAPLVFMIVI